MLFCTSLIALVGAADQPQSSPRKLQIVNTKVCGSFMHYYPIFRIVLAIPVIHESSSPLSASNNHVGRRHSSLRVDRHHFSLLALFQSL